MNNYSAPQKVCLPQPVSSMAASSDKFLNFVVWFPTAFQCDILYFYEASYMIENIPITKKYVFLDSTNKIVVSDVIF